MKRIALVGLGMMGSNHLRTMLAEPEVEVCGVVDPDLERLETAIKSGLAGFTSVEDLLMSDAYTRGIDGVVIATPTKYHHAASMLCLAAGIGVLVEKPIAATPDEAREMVALAIKKNKVLMPGHVERFNPVIRELFRHAARPLHIDARRIGAYSPRVVDGVVTDLMIHDLDIVRALAGGAFLKASAVTRSDKSNQSEDHAVALITFDNGVTASVTASRLGQQKVREYVVTLSDAVVSADLIRQDLSICRVQRTEYVSEVGVSYRQSTAVEVPFIEQRGEPLVAELRDFLGTLDGAVPSVTAEDGLAALELVGEVLRAV